jgi:putative oxidoreductase
MISIGLLILRLAFGLTVAAHGAQKVFGWFEGPGPKGVGGMVRAMGFWPVPLWATALSAAEFGGGLLVAFGFLTPIAALVVMGSMITAIATVHVSNGFFNAKGGVEFPFVIAAAMLSLAITGPGGISLDHLFGITLSQPDTVLALVAVVLLGTAAGLASRRLGSRTARQSRQPA